jgi:hypothetical protein
MSRFPVFILLGATSGVLFGLVLLVLPPIGPDEFRPFGLLAVSYVMALIPSAVVGVVDWALWAVEIERPRPLWIGAVGFVLGCAAGTGFTNGPPLLLTGLCGAIPAAMCSWLSGRST